MRRIVLPVIGAGTPADPRRVDLPTYVLVSESADGKTMTVDVPGEDFPDDAAWDAVPTLNGAGAGLDVSRLPIGSLDAWHAHLDERYKEHAGRFRPSPLRGQ